jgi:hypothetical protein
MPILSIMSDSILPFILIGSAVSGLLLIMVPKLIMAFSVGVCGILVMTVPPNHTLRNEIENIIKEQSVPPKDFFEFVGKTIVTKVAGLVGDPIIRNYYVFKYANYIIPGAGEMKFIGVFNNWFYLKSFSCVSREIINTKKD